ncbi:MAG: hypothetical protein HYR71_07635, partial [Chloroflexi bacterium]|nr:hypothetical protein [Chloroflexota bacterium]
MLLLLAILLAFLAQNLLAPSALDFLGVICVVGGLAALLFMQRGARPVRAKRRSPLSLQGRGVGGEGGGLLVPAVIRARGFAPTDALAALLALIIAVWQLVPARLAAGIFIVIAAVLFVRQCRGLDAEPRRSEAQPLTRGARALLIGIILLSAFALTVYENEHIQPGIHGDEAESGIEARNLNAGRYSSLIGVGWYDQPLPSFLAQAWGMRVFGDTIGGLRTTSAVV